MQFYTKKHQYYCDIDLHTKIIYICLLDSDGKVLVHKQTKANPEDLMTVIKPYLDDLVRPIAVTTHEFNSPKMADFRDIEVGHL